MEIPTLSLCKQMKTQMKKVLFISFDFLRSNEPDKPLAISSIIANAKADPFIRDNYWLSNITIDMLDDTSFLNSEFDLTFNHKINISECSHIFLSAYVWNEPILNPLMKQMRETGFTGKIILGGYQITYSSVDSLKSLYPYADHFIQSYAEEAVKYLLINDGMVSETVIRKDVDFNLLTSPYLDGEIKLQKNDLTVRFETKRGCPYKCSFCAHRDLLNNKVYTLGLQKVKDEISLFATSKVRKVNVLDPVFNASKNYIEILNHINQINSNATYALQSRFEAISGDAGVEFLNLVANGNYILEFGVQTLVEAESININRKNDLQKINTTLDKLRERKINFEVSVIYGLPGQTLESFKCGINHLKEKGCPTIKAYPLMLLRGTELYHQKEKWQLNEEMVGEYNIPLVTSGNSFSSREWYQMKELSESLSVNENRVDY
jgi:radical SAM superfamily enzyme YgiQ (UPF0313 family)